MIYRNASYHYHSGLLIARVLLALVALFALALVLQALLAAVVALAARLLALVARLPCRVVPLYHLAGRLDHVELLLLQLLPQLLQLPLQVDHLQLRRYCALSRSFDQLLLLLQQLLVLARQLSDCERALPEQGLMVLASAGLSFQELEERVGDVVYSLRHAFLGLDESDLFLLALLDQRVLLVSTCAFNVRLFLCILDRFEPTEDVFV